MDTASVLQIVLRNTVPSYLSPAVRDKPGLANISLGFLMVDQCRAFLDFACPSGPKDGVEDRPKEYYCHTTEGSLREPFPPMSSPSRVKY